jgi:hypothetical protein
MTWTTPDDIKQQLERLWSSGRLLTARLKGESLFPLVLNLRKPETADLAQRFEEVRAWIKRLETGPGYEIEWTERKHRELGRNRVPSRVIVPTESDALRILGKCEHAERFHALAAASLKTFPALEAWLIRRPLVALEHANDWNRILTVLLWFCANPGSGFYLRQVEIPEVDTKFIEERKGLFSELLDVVQGLCGEKTFEQRFGLSAKPSLVRFRLLDQALYIQGLSDLAIPAADFAQLTIAAKTVFITENDINGLAFPDVPSSLVIFGLGYGLERLGQATWLRDRTLYYWGDIDTHGFAMLDRLRAIFPHVKSFLMDRVTLMEHHASWAREGEPYSGSLDRLTGEEQSLFDDLRYDRFGTRVRLEQERISYTLLKASIHE